MSPAGTRMCRCIAKGAMMSFSGWAATAAYAHYDWTMICMLLCLLVCWFIDLELDPAFTVQEDGSE